MVPTLTTTAIEVPSADGVCPPFVNPCGRFTVGELPKPEPLIVMDTFEAPTRTLFGLIEETVGCCPAAGVTVNAAGPNWQSQFSASGSQ